MVSLTDDYFGDFVRSRLTSKKSSSKWALADLFSFSLTLRSRRAATKSCMQGLCFIFHVLGFKVWGLGFSLTLRSRRAATKSCMQGLCFIFHVLGFKV